MEQPRVMQVDNETNGSTTRMTKEGKELRYELKVLQQPLKARACGAGAKSSADRRPVDPPPIVELKIYDGPDNEANDVTFSMNANYFLFATLVQARQIAHGRVPEDKQRLTVLTGTPVAGMVYLDRPSPAGYFIFPDLSVRHEGKYRLSFSLYEELKDVKDDDNPDRAARSATPGDPCVTHRLEVNSEPFVVYSAKKFPGLTESTSLSRMVADQGCRVRIRRDVRMRRRDTKGGKDWDGYESDTAQARASMAASPDPSSAYPTLPTPHGYMDAHGRPRSSSNASHHSLVHPLSRRTSQEMNQAYNQPFGSGPQTPQHGYVQSSPYGPSPGQQYSQPPFMQQPSMQPPPPQYPPQQSYYAPAPMSAPPPSQHLYHSSAPPPAVPIQPSYPATTSYEHAGRMSGDYSTHMSADTRRYSTQYAPPPQQYPVHMPAQQAYQPPPQQPAYSLHGHQPSYSSSQDSFAARAPPPQPVQPPVRAAGAHTPLSSRPSYDRGSALPPLQVPADMWRKLEPSPAQSMAPDSYYSSTSASVDTRKRQHGSVFREPEQYAPLRQGARPSDSFASYPGADSLEAAAADDADHGNGDHFDSRPEVYRYRRAGGVFAQRSLPPHSDE